MAMAEVQISPERQTGSPQSNYSGCFRIQICGVKISKTTKDANQEILAARFGICWEKRKLNISINI